MVASLWASVALASVAATCAGRLATSDFRASKSEWLAQPPTSESATVPAMRPSERLMPFSLILSGRLSRPDYGDNRKVGLGQRATCFSIRLALPTRRAAGDPIHPIFRST